MLARLLRWELAIELLALLLAMHYAGVGLPYVPVAVFGGLFLIYGLLTLATFWIAGVGPVRAVSRLGLARASALFFREWLAFFSLFVIMQPFPFLFRGNGKPPKRHAAGTILLVHGYKCNAELWTWLKPRLRDEGYELVAINLEPAYAPLDKLVNQLHRCTETIAEQEEANKIVLIAHSMGGLVARACIERYGEGNIERIITIGTPHHGTRLAYYGLGKNARDMEPQSEWLKRLPSQWDKAIPLISIWSRDDNFVSPQSNAVLAGAINIEVHAEGHLTTVFSAEILRC